MPTKTRTNLTIKYHISQITISFRRTQVWEEATTTNQFKHTTNAKNHNKLINRKWRKLEKAYITPNQKSNFKIRLFGMMAKRKEKIKPPTPGKIEKMHVHMSSKSKMRMKTCLKNGKWFCNSLKVKNSSKV